MIFNHPNHESYQADIHSSSCFLFSTLQCQSACGATRQHCDAMSSCRPKCIFLGTLVDFVWHRSPFSEAFPCSIYLLSTSNNGSIGFTPQRTSKMISLSKDILFVVDLGHLESFVGRILGAKIGSRKKSNKSASESMCNMSTTATCSVT